MAEKIQPESQFNEKEAKYLRFYKGAVEKGIMGGSEDKSAEDKPVLDEVRAERLEEDWKGLSPELSKRKYLKYSEDEVAKRHEAKMKEHTGKIDKEREKGFYENVDPGSGRELVAKLVQEYYPELGVSVNTDEENYINNRSVSGLPNVHSVYIDPIKNEQVRPVLRKLINHPIGELVWPEHDDEGRVGPRLVAYLENKGILTRDVSKRILARYYRNAAEGIKESFDRSDPKWDSVWGPTVEDLEDDCRALGVEPMSDAELSDLLLDKVISPVLGQPKHRV